MRRAPRPRPGPARWALLLTVEHGGNRVPARYRALFEGCEALLATHRGWDPGALELGRRLARRLAARLAAPLVASTTTRLLCDLNRSVGHRRLFSERTRDLPAEERARILARHYHPHRARVVEGIERALGDSGGGVGGVVHVGVHSFTPVLDGEVRAADVGFLYDPRRPLERGFCQRWRAALEPLAPALAVNMNSPYKGTADGLPTALRRRFPADRYLGLEVEVCQSFPLAAAGQPLPAGARPCPASWRAVQRAVAESLALALEAPPGEPRRRHR